MTIADLDVAPPTAGRARRIVPSRPVALVLITLFTLVLVTGSVRSAARFTGVLWSEPYDPDNDTVTLTPASLFVTHHAVLTAYDLAKGTVRWSAPAPAVVGTPPSVAGGVLVSPDGFERYFERPDLLLSRTTRTIARDAATGAVLWRAAGAPVDVTDRSVLLSDEGDEKNESGSGHSGTQGKSGTQGETGNSESDGTPTLRAVDLHDGHTLWSRSAAGLAGVVSSGDEVITADLDGRLTVLRYADGSVTRTAKVPWPGSARLSAAAGRLVVTSQGPSGQANTVYRPDTLAEMWRAGGALTDCGPVMCGTVPGALAGLDPDTGARRWRLAGMTVAWPVAADRIVASSDLEDRFQLLDPETGRTLGPVGTGLGTWRPDPRTVVSGAPADSSAFALSAGAVVRLDLRTGEQYRESALDGGGWIGCRGVGSYLVGLQSSRLTVLTIG